LKQIELREKGAFDKGRVGKVHTDGPFRKDRTDRETDQWTETNWKRVEASTSSMKEQEKIKIVGCGVQTHVK